jgi:hypothetical protein
MKKRIDKAITRNLDKNFDNKFWNKFDSKFSSESKEEQNWQRLFAPLAMACALILLTVNLYTGSTDYSAKEISEFYHELEEVEQLYDVGELELNNDFYALID